MSEFKVIERKKSELACDGKNDANEYTQTTTNRNN